MDICIQIVSRPAQLHNNPVLVVQENAQRAGINISKRRGEREYIHVGKYSAYGMAECASLVPWIPIHESKYCTLPNIQHVSFANRSFIVRKNIVGCVCFIIGSL